MAMSKSLDSFLALYSREAREIALCLRKVILEVSKKANERIEFKAKMVTYGYGRNGADLGWVCAIAPHLKHVNLIFSDGAQIPDPEKLLKGRGKRARRVYFKSEVETANPALRVLLKNAIELSGDS